MATYRVFMFGRDDHILGAQVMDCPTDQEAIARAPDFARDYHAVEVWELGRRVTRLDARDPAETDRR